MIYGLDGSRSGWIALGQDTESGTVTWRRVPQLAVLLDETPRPGVVAVDVPVGLPDEGARACDVEARKRVGARRNSVFAAPVRPLLAAAREGDALTLERRNGKRISHHIWSMVPRILEVDDLLRQDPGRQATIREVHPEVSFTLMNQGVPMPHPKKSAEGREERRLLLRAHFGEAVDRALADRRRLRCAADDILDAFAALWTADRIRRGEVVTLPPEPPVDEFGLRMAISA
jgi:predicted RNase H-like nuclease